MTFHPRFWAGYAVLAFIAVALVGLAYKGIGERLYRKYVEETGAVVTGEVVGHRLYRCRGLFCSNRTDFQGEHGSASFDEFLSRCRGRNNGGCHTDVVVSFGFGGKSYQLKGQVKKRDFRRLSPGSPVVVLVNRKKPEQSLLRDYNPEGFLFWIAIVTLVSTAFAVSAVFQSRKSV